MSDAPLVINNGKRLAKVLACFEPILARTVFIITSSENPAVGLHPASPGGKEGKGQKYAQRDVLKSTIEQTLICSENTYH